MTIHYDYEKTVLTVKVNSSTITMKTNNPLSPQLTELHKKGEQLHMMLKIQVLNWIFILSSCMIKQ
jgi:hypothetical protein